MSHNRVFGKGNGVAGGGDALGEFDVRAPCNDIEQTQRFKCVAANKHVSTGNSMMLLNVHSDLISAVRFN